MNIYLSSLEICDTTGDWPCANTDDHSKSLAQIVAETVGDKADGKLTFWYKAGKVDYAVAIHLKEEYFKFSGCPRTAKGGHHLFIDIDKPCDTKRTLEEFIKEHEELIREYAPTISEEELAGPTIDEDIQNLVGMQLEQIRDAATSGDVATVNSAILKTANAIVTIARGK